MTKLLALTVGLALAVLTAKASVILNTDYTAAQGYTNGNLLGQQGWLGQARAQVNPNGGGTVQSAGGPYDRNGYGKGARGGTGGAPNASGNFTAGEALKFTFDYQFTIPGATNLGCARVGFCGGLANDPSPTNGMAIVFNSYQASTGGSIKWFPSMADTASNAYALILNGTDFGLDPGNFLGHGSKTNSDPMRVYYQVTCLGGGVWQPASLLVSNQTSGQTWSYAGPTRHFTNSITDAFYCQQLADNGVTSFTGVSAGVGFEYLPAPATLALASGDNQQANVGTGLGRPFVVTVGDGSGNPVADTAVVFAVATTPDGAAGQSLSITHITTGTNGQASSTLTLGDTAGTYTVTATSGSCSGSPVTFTAVATTTQAVVSVDLTRRRYIGGVTTFDRETWFGVYLEAGYGTTAVNIGGTNKTVDEWILDQGNLLPSRGTVGFDKYWNGSGYTPYSEDPAQPGYIRPLELTNYAVVTNRYVTGKTLNPHHKTIYTGKGQGAWPDFMCWPTNLTHGVNTVSNLAAYGQAVTIAYWDLVHAQGLIPQWYEVCNESDIPSNFGWFWNVNAWTNNALFHNAVADAMAVAWPQIKVAGPVDSWPYREGPNGTFGDWLHGDQAFVKLSGDHLGAYSFHAYEYDFTATVGSNTVFDAQFGSPHVWSKGRLECLVDLWENEQLLAWGTRKPFIMSEYGVLGWSNTNCFNYIKSCNAMLVALLDRPDIIDKMSVFILSYAPWNPAYRLTLFTSDDDGASYYPTQFANYLAFWHDLNGDYLSSASSSYHLLSRAFFTNNTAYVVLHNNHHSSFTVNVQPQLPAGATVLNSQIKLLFQNGTDLGYSDYAALAALTSVVVPAEATCILRLDLGGLAALPVVDEDNYYGHSALTDIGADVDETFTVNVTKNASQPIVGGRLYSCLFKTNGFAYNPTSVRVNGQSLTNVPDITHSSGVSNSWKQLAIAVPAAALVRGSNTVALRFPRAGGKITSVRLAVDSRLALNLEAHLLAVAPGGPVFQIQVPTVLGHHYNVYRTATAQPTAWNSLTNFPGTGTSVLVNPTSRIGGGAPA